MPDEIHKLQKDPPEGSRKTIERELERQSQKPKDGESKDDRANEQDSDRR